jgi:hypothetical protein
VENAGEKKNIPIAAFELVLSHSQKQTKHALERARKKA